MNLLSNIVEGRTLKEVDETVNAMLETGGSYHNDFFPEVHELLKENNYEIILISGGADFIIRNIAKRLGVKYHATVYECKNGVYIKQEPININGELKADIVREIIDDDTYSISFGDSEGDYAMFDSTDKAFLYTQNEEKIKEASRRGWIVINDENAFDEVSKVLGLK